MAERQPEKKIMMMIIMLIIIIIAADIYVVFTYQELF